MCDETTTPPSSQTISELKHEIERLCAAQSAALEKAAQVADEHQRKAEEQLKTPAEPMTEVMAWLFETEADTAADIAIGIRSLKQEGGGDSVLEEATTLGWALQLEAAAEQWFPDDDAKRVVLRELAAAIKERRP